MGANAKQAADLLRELAAAIEGGRAAEWEVNIASRLLEVSSIGAQGFIDNGEREVTVRVVANIGR